MRVTNFMALAIVLISSATAMPTNHTLQEAQGSNSTLQEGQDSNSTLQEYEEYDLTLDESDEGNLTSRDIWGPKHLRIETYTNSDCREQAPAYEIQHKDMKPGRCHANFKPFHGLRVGRDQKLKKWEGCILTAYMTRGCWDWVKQGHFPLDLLNKENLGRCIPNDAPIEAMKVKCKGRKKGKPNEHWSGDGWKGDEWKPKNGDDG